MSYVVWTTELSSMGRMCVCVQLARRARTSKLAVFAVVKLISRSTRLERRARREGQVASAMCFVSSVRVVPVSVHTFSFLYGCDCCCSTALLFQYSLPMRHLLRPALALALTASCGARRRDVLWPGSTDDRGQREMSCGSDRFFLAREKKKLLAYLFEPFLLVQA